MVKNDGSGAKGLTPYTCLCYRCCALEQALKDAHSKGPSNLQVRAVHLYWRLHLGKWNTLFDLPTSDCLIFTENEALVQITHYTSPNYTHRPKWIYTRLKIFPRWGLLINFALALKFFKPGVAVAPLPRTPIYASLRIPCFTKVSLSKRYNNFKCALRRRRKLFARPIHTKILKSQLQNINLE